MSMNIGTSIRLGALFTCSSYWRICLLAAHTDAFVLDHECSPRHLYEATSKDYGTGQISCGGLIEAGLKPGSFKESLVAKPLLNLDDLWKRVACFDDPDLHNKPKIGGRWDLCVSD
ncbi:hypothetical protein QL285_073781 [Trifolium repens]|nr:hypothetical protein QL285_073781 [Trifolium repens]